MDRIKLREKAIALRGNGKSYSEIEKILETRIPKGTLSYWCRNVPLPPEYITQIREQNLLNLERARKLSVSLRKKERDQYLLDLLQANQHLSSLLQDQKVAKLALVALYFGEGAKTRRGSLMLGNSEPGLIRLFMKLLRTCYPLKESKFRCTVQCRADQDTKKLNAFWSNITGVPLEQFYKPRIDSRTIGKPSKNKAYKGVCRVEYFGANVYYDLLAAIKVISS